jgi:hypothetical protein
VGYGIWNVVLIATTSTWTMATHPACAGSGAASNDATTSVLFRSMAALRLALCCDVAMAVSMVYMFSWVH